MVYDAVRSTKRRQAITQETRSEDEVLQSADRKSLLSASNDLRRNYVLAAWMLRKHVDYIATFDFQPRGRDSGLKRDLNDFVEWWSHKRNFDVSDRFSRNEFMRLAEATRTGQGDCFVYKISSGYLQLIEGDRIANPTYGQLPDRYNRNDFVHGVKILKSGKPKFFILNNRREGGGYVYNSVVPAKYMTQHAYWDRVDTRRGITPLAPVINTLKDTYEGITYALAKAKVSQMFGLIFKRAAEMSIGEVDDGVDDTDDEDKSAYDIDFGKGPFVADLDPGDEADFLESKTPSAEFRDFWEIMAGLVLKCLDIPYSFYNESFTNYSGARGAVLQYEYSANEKRRQNIDLINELFRWRLGVAIVNGDFPRLPRGMTINTVPIAWVPRTSPWIDPLNPNKEAEAINKVVEGKVLSRQALLRRMNINFWDVIEELAEEEEAIKERFGGDNESRE